MQRQPERLGINVKINTRIMYAKTATAIHVQLSCIFQVTVFRKGMLENKMGVNLASRAVNATLSAEMSLSREKWYRPVKRSRGGDNKMEDLAGWGGRFARRLWMWESEISVFCFSFV